MSSNVDPEESPRSVCCGRGLVADCSSASQGNLFVLAATRTAGSDRADLFAIQHHWHATGVVDAAFDNVQVFNEGGNLLMYFGGSYSGMGAMSLPAGITIDYTCTDYFREYVYEAFKLKYIIFVSNQFGAEKISVYGFVEPLDN